MCDKNVLVRGHFVEEWYVLPLWVLRIEVGSSGLCSKQLYPMVVPRSIFKKNFFHLCRPLPKNYKQY